MRDKCIECRQYILTVPTETEKKSQRELRNYTRPPHCHPVSLLLAPLTPSEFIYAYLLVAICIMIYTLWKTLARKKSTIFPPTHILPPGAAAGLFSRHQRRIEPDEALLIWQTSRFSETFAKKSVPKSFFAK